MELDELTAIVSDWYSLGRISPTDRERVKQEAFRVGAADPEGCKTCPNFWNNVMQNLIYYLRQNNKTVAKTQGKYMFPEGTGSMMLPMSSVQLIAEGENSEFLKLIGDPANEKLIEDHLKAYPALKEVILKNPDYKPVEAKSTGKDKDKPKDTKVKEQTTDTATGNTPTPLLVV